MNSNVILVHDDLCYGQGEFVEYSMRTRGPNVLVVCLIVCLGVLVWLDPATGYAASGGDTPSTPSPVKIARDLVKQEKYQEALVGLKKALTVDAKNADLLNLTGYSHRKLQDLDNAYKFYDAALAVNPEHKGALNYLGILYVNTGQPEKAEALLARLDDACFFTCDEYTQLKQAIENGSAPEW